MRPHRQQPTKLLCPWDSPGKNTGVGFHFLFQCMKVKSESEVAQSCPTLSNPWTAAHQAPPSMGFSRQEDWSGLPLPFSGRKGYSRWKTSSQLILFDGIAKCTWKILNQYLYSFCCRIPFGKDAQAYTNPRSLQCFHWLYYMIEIYSVDSVPKVLSGVFTGFKFSMDKIFYLLPCERSWLPSSALPGHWFEYLFHLSVYNLSTVLMHGYG